MSERNINSEPPEWHLKYLEDREGAVCHRRRFIHEPDDFEAGLRSEIK
ncbi:MAG: hypothetical protein AB7F88_01445 [Pyrinomonadaceae bacterium]